MAMDPLLPRIEEMGKRDFIRLERESVIPILKYKIIHALANHIENWSERGEFLKLCQRFEYTIRAFYLFHFEDFMQLYALFDPVLGPHKLEQQNLSLEETDAHEHKFLNHLFKVMEKSNFKVITDEEVDIALSAQYCLNLPIIVEETKLDKQLLTRYFAMHPRDNLPSFANKYIIFRRGYGVDHLNAYFFEAKVNTIVARIWKFFMTITGIRRLLHGKRTKESTENVDIKVDSDNESLYIERIRIETLKLSLSNLLKRITIQEPTFERMIVVFRKADSGNESERNIYVKHFKHIPMADMEIVLPAKKNPGLTPLDWLKFLVSAAIGLVTVISSLSITEADIWVIVAILSTVVGYCVKTYFTFQRNLVDYQSLITRSVYDKQLDSGKGTLLHLCDDVIQQEVKEVIVSYFVLLRHQRALTKEELGKHCEELIKKEFKEMCNFDVEDALKKLQKLKIVFGDPNGMYTCVDLKQANKIIGTTTEELVLRAEGRGDDDLQGRKQSSELEEEDPNGETKETKIHPAVSEFQTLS